MNISPNSPHPITRNKRILIIGIAALAIAAAGVYLWLGSDDTDSTQDTDISAGAVPGGIRLNDEQIKALGILTEKTVRAESVPLPGLPAQTQIPLDASARIVIPYAGVVTRISSDDGAMVAKNQAVARIQSREFLTAQAELANARNEAHTASLQARRDAQLLTEGIIPASRYEQTRLRVEMAQDALRQTQGALSHLRIPGDGQPGEYELLAPVAGRILQRDIAPGQTVTALDSAFVISQSRHLDIVFNAPIRAEQKLTTGLPVRLPDGSTATVMAVGASTDSASQSLRMRASLDEDSSFVVGQQFDVTLLLPAPEGAIAVPSSALLPEGSRHVLYVRTGQDFRAIVVDRLGGDGVQAVVRGEGLLADMDVITRGTIALKSLIPVE
ncbi:MAG: efflux RND transporter periplasmic adaptor subunit [Xanthomonadaceae bacterium]|jgi:RND family efflux transporter MFP subunit|nr:efflux RND transporter periplasmic adaptor subunit [Xanthomonadaceae bacterium]